MSKMFTLIFRFESGQLLSSKVSKMQCIQLLMAFQRRTWKDKFANVNPVCMLAEVATYASLCCINGV